MYICISVCIYIPCVYSILINIFYLYRKETRWWINVNRLGMSIRCAILYVYLFVSMIVLSNTICAILYVLLFYIYICRCVYVCMYVYVCVWGRGVYVHIHMYIFVYVQIHMYIFEEWFFFSLFSFLFCVPHSCLPTVSLEVDVQKLKPPSAKPRTGKYVRVGYNKKRLHNALISRSTL